ncbi:hypothetical protein AAMO2058_001040700 [Amorphochlora amoebiformis]
MAEHPLVLLVRNHLKMNAKWDDVDVLDLPTSEAPQESNSMLPLEIKVSSSSSSRPFIKGISPEGKKVACVSYWAHEKIDLCRVCALASSQSKMAIFLAIVDSDSTIVVQKIGLGIPQFDPNPR